MVSAPRSCSRRTSPTLGAWLDRVEPSGRDDVEAGRATVACGEREVSEYAYDEQLADVRRVRIRERLAAIWGGNDRVERVTALLRLEPAGDARG